MVSRLEELQKSGVREGTLDDHRGHESEDNERKFGDISKKQLEQIGKWLLVLGLPVATITAIVLNLAS
jgi:hypothetical protein